jgi:transcriptional regulator with XRE-family HTH domain
VSKLISGSDLKIKLKRKKIKIEDLIEKYGLKRATVSRYLNNHMAMPATFIIQVAEISGMDIKEFMTQTEEEKSSTTKPEDIKPAPEEPEEVRPETEAPKTAKEYIIPDLPELVIKGDTAFDAKAPLKWLEINSTELEKYILSLEARIKNLETRIIKLES